MSLADRLLALLGPDAVAACARALPGAVETAVVGADEAADWEIGSVSKGLTGLMYADALERGEVTPDTTLATTLGLGDAVGSVTLGALAVHRSGLPRLAPGMQPLRRTVEMYRHGTNPYREDLPALLDQARDLRPRRPRPRYSNLGYQLLGHALAAAAGTTYAALLRARVADPLDLPVCYAPAGPHELRPEALVGRDRRGRAHEPWTGEGIGPAGGVRMDVVSLGRLVAALAVGAAPGIDALDPVADFGPGARIGAAWITLTQRGRTVTFHNGGTGGFRSVLAVDRAAGTGVALVAATSRSVDRHGFDLLP